MSVKVSVNPNMLGVVLSGNGQEIMKFRRLGLLEQNEILTETHQRTLLRNFFGSSCSWERLKYVKNDGNQTGKAGKNKAASADGSNIDNEVLTNVIHLATKSKVTETHNELVSVNRMVKTGDKYTSVPGMEMKEMKTKEPKATAKVSFYFDTKKSVLVVDVVEVTAKDPATQIYYRKNLEKALKDSRDEVEYFYSTIGFLKSFFDTLHVHKLSYITGSEAVNMLKIYKNAKVAYPLFAKMQHVDQVDVLDKGYRKARSVSAGSRDIHAFAKGTFEAMCDRGGIIDEVYKHDFITNQMMTYRKIGEHRRDRVNPDCSSQIWEKNCLVFVDYVYGRANIRTSLLPFDLWDLLARGVKANANEKALEAIW